MKIKIQLFILLILLNCFFTTVKASVADNNNYFPMDVGSEWNFEITANGQKMPMSYIAAEKATIDGIDTVLFEMKQGNQVQQREYYTLNETGIFAVLRELSSYSFLFEPKQYFLKYPVIIGDTWEQTGSFGDKSKNLSFNYQLKCEYIGMETIQVPAGNFNTLKLSVELVASDGSHIKGYRYFSQGIGLIKEDFKFTMNNTTFPITSELTKYKLVSK